MGPFVGLLPFGLRISSERDPRQLCAKRFRSSVGLIMASYALEAPGKDDDTESDGQNLPNAICGFRMGVWDSGGWLSCRDISKDVEEWQAILLSAFAPRETS